MRFATALVSILMSCSPLLAQEEADPVWPTPHISADVSLLPKATQKTRQLLIEAARSGDIENLRKVFAAQEFPPQVSFGEPNDTIGFLKDISEDDEGRQMLGLILDLLDQPFAWYSESGGTIYYTWPYLSELDPNALTPEQEVDAYRLLSAEDLEQLKNGGAWYYWRLSISEDGEWSSLIAGD